MSGSSPLERLAEIVLADCLAKPGAYLDHPFGPDVTTARVRAPSQAKGPIFLMLIEVRGVLKASFRCEPEAGLFWRERYPGLVVRGYHCPPVQQPYSNTVVLDGRVPEPVLLEMADDSWEFVVAKLPGWARRELLGPEAPSSSVIGDLS